MDRATWCIASTHTRRVGKVSVLHPPHGPVIGLDTHGSVEMVIYSGDNEAIAQMDHSTEGHVSRATTYLTPEQAREVIARLTEALAALAEAETTPENRKAVA